MLLGAVLIRVAVGRNVFACRALALLKRIGISGHDLAFLAVLDLALFGASALFALFSKRRALLRSASFRSMGTPCFLSRSANASAANSWIVAMRSRPNWVSLSSVSSSKAINFRTTRPGSCAPNRWKLNTTRSDLFPPATARRRQPFGVEFQIVGRADLSGVLMIIAAEVAKICDVRRAPRLMIHERSWSERFDLIRKDNHYVA